MSDINGEGFGSIHNWKRGETSVAKFTIYHCVDCNYPFVHYYDLIPEIFDAMKENGIPALCVNRQVL